MAVKAIQKVNEKSTCLVIFDLEGYKDVLIPVANITTATFTLKDILTGTVINSRTSIDCKSSFDTNGHFEFLLVANDNIIVNAAASRPNAAIEEHIFILTVVATSGGNAVDFKEEAIILVNDLTNFS